jgi:hypothetical protein
LEIEKKYGKNYTKFLNKYLEKKQFRIAHFNENGTQNSVHLTDNNGWWLRCSSAIVPTIENNDSACNQVADTLLSYSA